MKLTITKQAYAKLAAYITNCESEISGLGMVREIEGASYEPQVLPMSGLEKPKYRWDSDDRVEDCKACIEEYQRGSTIRVHSCTDRDYRRDLFLGSWFGDREAVSDGVTVENVGALEVYDVKIFPQTVSFAHTSLDQGAMAKFLHEAIRRKEKVQDYRVWWHSHASMEAFFSGTDTNTIESSFDMPYLVSIVGNHELRFAARVDIFKPLRLGVSGLRLYLTGEEVDIDENEIKREIREKVKQNKSYLTSKYGYGRL